MKVYKSIIIWGLWVFVVVTFSFVIYAAPGSSGILTAPEVFLSFLGVANFVLGLVLLVSVFLEDNE